jgi:hypothetical protein
MEDSMKPFARSFAMVTGLVLLLTITPSWGQPVCSAPGCNPTVSDGNFNTAGGTGALSGVTSGTNNTAFGRSALAAASGGDENTAVGSRVLILSSGTSNTGVGSRALSSNTTGDNNTAIGSLALRDNTTGVSNTATGANALLNNTGGFNTASGVNALLNNTTGVGNTATGVSALSNNITGDDNTASGRSALLINFTGFGNTAVGRSALFNSTGNKNIGIGYLAGTTLTSGNNNIFIGNQGAGAESQTIRVGTAQTRTFIAGINVAGVSGATVIVDGNGQLGVPFSSARYKQDITPMGNRSEKVLALRPVTFAYKDDALAITHYGLIAEEVATVYPDLVTRTASGEVQTVKYQELIPMLLNELQRQRQTLERQEQALQRQQQESAEVAKLRQELAEFRALVGSRSGEATGPEKGVE